MAFSISYLFIIQCFGLEKKLPRVYDNFHRKCIDWENQTVILTLKNGKAYIAVLWKYPESPTARHESQTISIVPYSSGYRDDVTKEIIWTTHYPEYENDMQFLDMEIIIPRSEIVTFGKFNEKVFDYFYKK